MEELTKEGIVAFSFIPTDDGPELMGEEDIASKWHGQNPPASIQEWCSRGWIVRLPRGLRGPSGRDSARQLHLNRLKEGKCWTSLWWRRSWGGHRWQQAWNECTRKTGRPKQLCFARFSGHCCSQSDSFCWKLSQRIQANPTAVPMRFWRMHYR